MKKSKKLVNAFIYKAMYLSPDNSKFLLLNLVSNLEASESLSELETARRRQNIWRALKTWVDMVAHVLYTCLALAPALINLHTDCMCDNVRGDEPPAVSRPTSRVGY